MKFIKFTDKYLEKFFEDNFIEDDNLFDFLKGREGTIEEDNDSETDKDGLILKIRIVLKDL